MTRGRPAAESGFTLLEVLIAMLIFSIGTLGVLALVTTSITLNANSRYFSEASVLGQWKLDELLTVSPLTPAPAIYTGCSGAGPRSGWCKATGPAPVTYTTAAATVTLSDIEAQAGQVGSNSQYQVAWGVDALPNPNAGLYAITVTVAWPRDKNKIGIPAAGAGFVNCMSTPTQCYSLDFHAYRAQ